MDWKWIKHHLAGHFNSGRDHRDRPVTFTPMRGVREHRPFLLGEIKFTTI
jgi:hypothetical protein